VKSIRIYLVLAILAAITLINFVAAVRGYRASMAAAETLLDTQLADTAALIQSMQPAKEPVSMQPSDRLAFQIWADDGTLIQRSSNSAATPITEFRSGYREENFAGYRWRVLSVFDSKNNLWLLVAERIDIRVELTDGIIVQAIIPVVLSLPLIAIIVWIIVGVGLSLIRQLARELGAKRADDLSRLRTDNPPTELVPVVDAINDLLRRLNESVQRERRFSADAAHELRTPLSAIKVHVHNLKKGFPERAEELQVLDRDLGRLAHLIDQIMLLYRMTPENYQENMTPVDLHALAQSVIGELYPEIDRKNQTISLVGRTIVILGDVTSLDILLRNLVLNASKYSPEFASIEVSVEREESGTHLSVRDTGPGIPPAEINLVFNRFHRAGGDRHGSHVDGCGLGLSIVSHIADLHLASISLQNNSGTPGLTVDVIFPSGSATFNAPESPEK